MSVREENIRIRIETIDDLSSTAEKYDRINDLIKQQTNILAQSQAVASAQSNAQIQAINSVTDALKKQQAESSNAARNTADSNDKVSKSFDALGGQVRSFTSLLATAFTIDRIKQFGLDIIESKTRIDDLKVSLDVLIGSKKESAELYDQIVKLAQSTPFSVSEVADQVVKLRAYNIATADLIPTVNALGNIAAAVGKDKLPQLTLAYGQVATANRLMLTELRQFNESGVPLVELIATAYGKTRDEVQKMADAHQISFDMVKRAIMAASEEGGKFFGLMSLQSKTVGGEVRNLSDAYDLAKARIGDFFQDTIQNGTRSLANLTSATLGSNSAITRTLDIVKSAVSAFITYQVATNASATASALLAGYEASKNVLYGAYLLTLRAVTLQQTVYTAAQTESIVAARAFGAALSANPIGAVAAAVGVLVTAFYAYKVVTDEVVSAMGEEELKLKAQKADLNTLADAALNAASGTKQRKETIELLIQKYPEYFSGLSTERTSNQQLKTILDSVNSSYSKRIDLAREAYKTEGIANAQKELFEKEEAFFKSLAKLNDDHTLEVQFGGSIKKLVETLDAGGVSAEKLKAKLDESATGGAEFFAVAARSIAGQFSSIEKQGLDSTIRTKKIGDDARNAEVEAIQKHYDVLRNQAAGNSLRIQKLNEEEKIAISKANGTYHEKELAAIDTQQKKKVEKAKLSAAELSALLKADNDQTLADKLKLLDAQEKVEIEAANKSAKNKADATARILAIDARYNVEREKLFAEDRENFSRSLDVDISGIEKRTTGEIQYVNIRTQSFKEIAKQSAQSEKDIQEIQKKTHDLNVEQTKIELETKKELVNFSLNFLSQEFGLVGEVGKGFIAVLSNIDALSGKSEDVSRQNVDKAKTNLALIKAAFEQGIAGTKESVANAEEGVADAEKKSAEAKLKSLDSIFQVFGVIHQVLSAIAAAYNEMMAETYKAIAESLGRARQAYTDFYDFVAKSSEEAYRNDLASFTGTLAEKERLITDYYAKEKEFAIGRDRIDAQLAYYQKIAQVQADAGTDAKKLIEGTIRAQTDLLNSQYQSAINQAEKDKLLAADVRDTKIAAIDAELVAFKAAKNEEINALKNAETEQINAVTTARDEKIKRQNDELTNFKNNLNDQIAALTDNLNQQKELLGIASSDDQIRLTADAVFRKQLMDAGEIREVENLEKSRDRELARTTDAGERTRIMNAYEQLIKEKHEEYQTAIGDKSKEVSLAIKEVKAEEATTLQGYELDTATKIKDLKDQILTKEKTTATEIATIQKDAATETSRIQKETYDLISKIQLDIANQEYTSSYNRKLAQEDYAKAREASERQIFANEKALQIASLQAEIAVLNSKKNWYNEGRIIDAVGVIERSIADINNIAFASSTAGSGSLGSFIGSYFGQAFVLGFNELPTKPTRLDDHKTVVDRAYDAKGNFMEITYNATGKVITAYDKDGKSFEVAFADGFVPATGQRLFKGSPYVELGGALRGIDTIPAMLTEGERVIPAVDNMAIGGRSLSNKELVNKVKYADLLIAQFPQYQMSAQMGYGQLRLPEWAMKDGGKGQADMAELTKAFKSMEETFKRKELVSIQMDKAGFSTALIGVQSKVTYHDNLFRR